MISYHLASSRHLSYLHAYGDDASCAPYPCPLYVRACGASYAPSSFCAPFPLVPAPLVLVPLVPAPLVLAPLGPALLVPIHSSTPLEPTLSSAPLVPALLVPTPSYAPFRVHLGRYTVPRTDRRGNTSWKGRFYQQ
jgi:hypothetical protein